MTMKPLAYSLAEMRRAVEWRLGERSHEHGVLTEWLRGHEHSVMEITIFPFATFPLARLDHAEQVLAALPNIYRLVRIIPTDGVPDLVFGRQRGLRMQVRALVAMNSVALQRQPLGRGGWAESPRPGIEFR
jgi:hypothetical protein